MIDRRKNPREFFVAGWDPYVLSLVSKRSGRQPNEDRGPKNRKLGPTRWRTMLLRKSPSGSS
jgi:hypothetical protein